MSSRIEETVCHLDLTRPDFDTGADSRCYGFLHQEYASRAQGMAAQAVLFIQQGGHLEFLASAVWDTSWLLPEGRIVGRLLHTLVGYSDAPSGAQPTAYLAHIGDHGIDALEACHLSSGRAASIS